MATMGSALPLTITSRTRVRRRRPIGPPGCERAKSSTEKPRASSSTEGERVAERKHRRRAGRGREAERTGFAVDRRVEVNIGGLRNGRLLVAGERDDLRALPLEMRRQQEESSDSPEFESITTTSAGRDHPRSPCEASAG
jgi:hypothetical protein